MVIRSPHTTHRLNGFPFDLASWLHEQLEADEQSVKATVPGPWSVGVANFDVYAHVEGLTVMENFDDPRPWHRALPDYMARYDPTRMLDEVRVKQLLLDEAVRALFDDVTDETAQWTLRVLALPYTQYPGFQEAWRL